MEFKIKGTNDPFLSIKLELNEQIHCESNSMISLDDGLEISAKVKNGILGALSKKLLSNKSFFSQSIQSKSKNGEVLISPLLPGDIKILNINENESFCLNDGAFLAATDSVEINIKRQKTKVALFGGSGGFFINQTKGIGTLAITGFGSIIEKKVSKESPLIVDNNFVLAWSDSLSQEVTIKSNNKNILHNLINSYKTGESITNKFCGDGTVYLCSKNRKYYIKWLRYITTIAK